MIRPTIISAGDWHSFVLKNEGGHFIHCKGSYYAFITISRYDDGGRPIRRKEGTINWIVEYFPDINGNNRKVPLYSIVRLDSNKIGRYIVNEEEFLLFLKGYYPDHFKWFLFNLDILR